MGWTDERIERLRKLWRDGLSASQIARQLGGVTRNAVIGKVHRLGLSGRAQPSRPRRITERAPRRPRPAPAPRPVRVTPLPVLRIVSEAPGSATPLTLGAHMCKWPIGDPKAEGFTFCGRRAHGPYCEAHNAVAYQPRTGRGDDLVRALRRYLG